MSLRSIPPEMDGEKVALIDALLDRIADEHKVFLPLAIESGSRAWGFSSPDSDYDCRFVFVRRIAEHITPWPARDVIEFPPKDDLDANGWDLGKALRLLLKGNAVIVEWLLSPVIYRGQAWFRDGFLEFARHAATREAIGRHYLHLGERQRRVYFGDGTSVAQKKIFYALRPAASLALAAGASDGSHRANALPDTDGGMRSPGRVEPGGCRPHAPQACDARAWRCSAAADRRALSSIRNSNWRGRRLRAVARGRPKKSSRRPNDSTGRSSSAWSGMAMAAPICRDLRDAATRFPICAKPERLPPSRSRLFGAAEFRPGAPGRRQVPAADRGHRRDQMPAGIRGGDLRRPRLARDILGNAGAAAIGAFCALSGGGRKIGRPGPDLSELREPRGNRPSGCATRSRRALAARSRRGAALSGRREIAVAGPAPTVDRARHALRAAARHAGRARAYREN